MKETEDIIKETEFKTVEGLGKIPKDWTVKTLKQIATICYGKDQKDVEDQNGKYPILGTGGIIGKSNKYLYNKPSVLIGRKGTINNPVYIEEPFWTVDTLFYTDIYEKFHPKWFYYSIRLVNLLKYNEATGVPSLNVSNLDRIRFAVPRLEEQQKIANILSKVDSNIGKTEQIIEKYQKIKKGLMDDLLTGKVRIKDGKMYRECEFKEVEGVGRIPNDWETEKLGKYADIQGGFAFSSSDYCNDGVQLLKIGNVFGDKLSLDRDKTYLPLKFINTYSEYVIRYGDIIISMTGTIGKRDYGYAVKVNYKYEVFMLNQRLGRFVCKENINKDFLLYILHANYFLDKLYTRAGGTKQANLTSEQILSILVCVPELNEQEQIANILSKQDQLIEKEQQCLEKLKKLKAGLMEDLLTGKVRVR